jgi:hypothetical protein
VRSPGSIVAILRTLHEDFQALKEGKLSYINGLVVRLRGCAAPARQPSAGCLASAKRWPSRSSREGFGRRERRLVRKRGLDPSRPSAKRDGRAAEALFRAMNEAEGQMNGAEERTRTSTRLPGPDPESGASTNSATSARLRASKYMQTDLKSQANVHLIMSLTSFERRCYIAAQPGGSASPQAERRSAKYGRQGTPHPSPGGKTRP